MSRGSDPVLQAKAAKLRKQADELEGKAKPPTPRPIIDVSSAAPTRRLVNEGSASDFMKRARAAQNRIERQIGSGDSARYGVDPFAPKRAAEVMIIDPRESIAVLAGRMERDERYVPLASPAGETATFSAVVAAQSRVARAGARLLWIPQPKAIVAAGGFQLDPVAETFSVLKPAPFDVVEFDDLSGDPVADLVPGDWPVREISLDRETLRSYGVSFTLPRRARIDRGEAIVSAEMIESIAAGIAHAVDHELVGAMDSAMRLGDDSPNAAFNYSHRRAAESGSYLHELAGLLGSESAAVITLVAPDGTATINGFPVDFCAAARANVLANFSRFGVWIDPEITLAASRLANDGLQVACWIRLQAAMPDPGAMWWAPF